MTTYNFKNLSPEKRAQMLHRLFPAEIPGYLNHLQGAAMRTIGDQELFYRAWTGPLASFYLWIEVIKSVYDNVLDHSGKMESSRRAFSKLLFTGNNRFFSQHALMGYIQHRSCTNIHFKRAAVLLFS